MTGRDESSGDESREYFREIELHWSWRRENQIILSPVEFECMDGWWREGIPVSVVLSAIDRFVEAKKKRGGTRHYLLSHADDLVRKRFAEYQLLHVGEGARKGAVDVAARLSDLVGQVRRLSGCHPAHQGAIDKAVGELESISAEDVVSLEELEDAVARIDAALLAEFKSGLSEDDRRGIYREVSQFVAQDDEKLFERLVNDFCRLHFDLPRLTVLG